MNTFWFFLTIFNHFDKFWQFLTIFDNFLQVGQSLFRNHKILENLTILENCDIWDTDYNCYNWEPEFMTIFDRLPLFQTEQSQCQLSTIKLIPDKQEWHCDVSVWKRESLLIACLNRNRVVLCDKKFQQIKNEDQQSAWLAPLCFANPSWRRGLCDNIQVHSSLAWVIAIGMVAKKGPFCRSRLLRPWSRLERCIVTIASLDQWLATIENHHYQWLTDQKTIEKPLVPMVEQLPFHQWQWSP